MNLLKKIVMLIGVIVVLIFAAGLLLPVFIDVNDYKTKIEQLVEENIGRKLTLHGDLELKTFPFLRVKTGELSLENPAGFPHQNMLEIESAEIGIRLLPLLFKKVEAGTIKFDAPVINLTKKSTGQINWEFESDNKSEDENTTDENSGSVLAAIAIQGFEITNAQLNYADLSSDTLVSIDNLNLTTGSIIPGTSFPVEISTQFGGSMLAEPIQVNLEAQANLDIGFEQLTVSQLSSVLNQSESSYQLISGEINFHLKDNQLAIKSVEIKNLGNAETQTEVLIDSIDMNLNSLIANVNNSNANIHTADLDAMINLPGIEFDANKFIAMLTSIKLEVKNSDLNAQFILPETNLDLSRSDLALNNLNGNYTYKDLSGVLSVSELSLNQDTMAFAVTGIETAIANSNLQSDITGRLSPLDLNFNLNTDNLNIKEILKALGTVIETKKETSLTQLNFKLTGNYQQDNLTIATLTGSLDDTTINGSASIKEFSAPVYDMNLNLGDFALDDYLPETSNVNDNTADETAATAAGAPMVLTQFNITAAITADRIFSPVNGIDARDLNLTLTPNNGKSAISFKSSISGDAVPEPINLDVDTLAFINTSKSTAELSDLKIMANGKTINASLNVPLLIAPFSAGNINIEKITAAVSSRQMTSNLSIPDLNYNTAKSSLVIKNVTGTGTYNDISADILLPNLSVALDSQHLKINELALDLSGTKPVGRLSVPTLDINLASKTLGPTDIVFEGQDGRAQLTLKPVDELDSYSGNFIANDFNLRGILNRFNLMSDLDDKSALTRINIKSPISFNQSTLRLENIKASIDDTNLSGNFDATIGLNPVYNFSIKVGELNADRYFPAKAQSQSSRSTKAVAAPVAIPVELFKQTTASGDLYFEKLLIGGAQFSDFRIGVKSEDGKLFISPINSNFFNGKMNGNLAVDSTSKAPKLDFDYALTKVALEPALTSLGISDKLAGNGNFSLKMGAAGNTDKEMISTVRGNASLDVSNGTLKGINLQDILFKGYQTYASLKNKNVNSKYNPAQHTEFSALTGTWTINSGTISGNDLQIQAPLFRIDGQGDISLVNNTIDYLLNVKVVKSLEGQGGKSMKELEGRTIPLSITGSLDNPQYRLDISTLVKAQAREKAEEKIQEKIEDKLGEKLDGEGTLQEKLQKKAVEKAGEKLLDLFNNF